MSDAVRHLLISPEQGAWLKNLNALVDGFSDYQLAEWWCDLNEREWPANCPLYPLTPLLPGVMSLAEGSRWDVSMFFDHLTAHVTEKRKSLHWKARHEHGYKKLAAQLLLEQEEA